MRILIVDDEPMILKGLRFALEQEGYEVDEALDGQEALDSCAQNRYDLMLLDVMLPKVSGVDVLCAIRESSDMPIIMLTAKGDDMDRILGLEYGADDYMVKPFNILEVKARIKTVLRRAARPDKAKATVLQVRDIQLDKAARSVRRGDIDINLTVREFNLLQILITEPGRVFAREELQEILWKTGQLPEETPNDLRTVDVHIRRLREKVELNPAKPEYIMTKWGVGYYFAVR